MKVSEQTDVKKISEFRILLLDKEDYLEEIQELETRLAELKNALQETNNKLKEFENE